MKSNNKKKMPKAGQAGNGTKPHVRRSTVKYKDGLKPCPFCAREPEMQQHEGLNCWFVYCKCGLQSPKDSVSKNGAKVIWNRRRFVG